MTNNSYVFFVGTLKNSLLAYVVIQHFALCCIVTYIMLIFDVVTKYL